MKKSLFKKFYITYLSVVLAGFLLLGGILLAFSGNYLLGQNKQLLLSHSETISGQIESAAFVYGGAQLNQYAYQISSVVCSASDCQALVVNATGQPVACVGERVNEISVSPEFLLPYFGQSGTFVGDMGGVLKSACVVAASPLVINGDPCGVVYSVMPLGQVGGFMWDLFQLLLIAALLIAVVMGIAAYFMASTLVRPLTQMSEAAKCLAEGDFSRRIEVTREDEIGQLAQAFNDMTLSLEAGEKMRKGFVANVSHELKTPMTTIAGFVDGVLDGTVPTDKQKEYLAIVSGEIKRLSRLVNTMLNLSKLEAGEIRLNLAPMDLSQRILQATFFYEKKINEKHIRLNGLEELSVLKVMADGDLMDQVIYNLLDNSVKYTPEGGWIRIRGFKEDGKVHFSIRNSGDGIDEKDLPFVFDRFYKADKSRSADKSSLGLGLYLVKTIVALHGGFITVRSIKGSFCEFELVLDEHTNLDNNISVKEI